jgi:hypothetical protein
MPPTIPESDFETMEGNKEASNDDKYVYDIKFEVVLKEELEQPLPTIASALTELIATKQQALRIALLQSGKARQSMQITRIDNLESLQDHAKASVIKRIKR